MAITSGTSVLGLQVLQTAATAPSKLLSIAITSQPLPPVRRLGYYWLYQYQNSPPYQCYIVEEGLLRAPGIFIPLRLPVFSSDFLLRLDADWSLPGQDWRVSLA